MSPANQVYLKLVGLLLIIAIIAGSLYGAYDHGVTVTDSRWKALLADQQVLQAKGLAAATTANRIEEQRRQTAFNQVGHDAREQIKAATAAANGADAAGERVRSEAGNLAARSTCAAGGSGTTERGQAARRAAMVLSDLFQRADKRAGELARAYDSARVAGLACERAYAALNGMPVTAVSK
jgi:hypothetical protein